MDFDERILNLDQISFNQVIDVAASLIPPESINAAKARVSGGIRLLNHESELNDYLVAFGEIHQAKLMEFLPSIPFRQLEGRGLILVDWGCGQGLATAVTLDYLRELGVADEVRAVRMIELVEPALRRAVAIVSKYRPDDSNDFRVEWKEDALERISQNLPDGVPVLHLFSNILDVRDLDITGVRAAVERMRRGRESYVLSVGPDMETSRSCPKQLLDFLKSFDSPGLLYVYPKGGSARLYGRWQYWQFRYCKCYGFAYSLAPTAAPAIKAPPEKPTGPVLKPVSEKPAVPPEMTILPPKQGPELVACPPPPPDPEDLVMYASDGSLEEVESMLSAGVDIDWRTEKGATALYFAAKHGYVDIVKALIAAGANTEISVASTGMTPYLIAVKYGCDDVVRALTAAGCNTRALDAMGRDAETIARVYGIDQ